MEVTEPRTHVVRFRAPTKPLSVNDAMGRHWGVVKRQTRPWKQAAMVAWMRRDMGPAGPRFSSAVTIAVTIPFPRGGRRDPHNYTGTVVKAVVDGLVLAGAIPDDTQEWATVMDPTLVVDPSATVVVTVTERTHP